MIGSSNVSNPDLTSSSSSSEKQRRLRKAPPTSRGVPSASLSADRPVALALVGILLVYTAVTCLAYYKLSERDGIDQFDTTTSTTTSSSGSSGSQQQQQQQRFARGDTTDQLLRDNDHEDPIHQLQHMFPIHSVNDTEVIIHPGLAYVKHDKDLPEDMRSKTLRVPRFFDEIYGNKFPGGSIRAYLGDGERLMTPEEAASIGSYDVNGRETIYTSVASYRDPACTATVQDLYERAAHPERVRVAVVDQRAAADQVCAAPVVPCSQDPEQVLCKYRHLIDVYDVDARYSVGPVFARHLAHRFYRGEYFAMQVDAHVRVTQDWDQYLVDHWKSSHNEMAVLTSYVSDLQGRIDPVTHKGTDNSRPIMCKSDFEGGREGRHLRHGQQPEGLSMIPGQPTLEPFWAAGFSFARGHFVIQVPYDQYLPNIFQGEEISIGLRGFTYGYDYYAPQIGVVFHIYASNDPTGTRRNVPLFWENTRIYRGVGNRPMKRLNSIIGMGRGWPEEEWPHEEVHKYGLGKVRTTDKFFTTFGIHVDKQRVEGHLCRFVGKPMMKEFLPYLRENRMGIAYDKISYAFVDPDTKQKKK